MKKQELTTVPSWKFSNTASETAPEILNPGETPQDFLKRKFQKGCIFGRDNLQKGGYKLAGWYFDFRPFMKRFIVRQYDQWETVWAPNKTLLRASTYGRIAEIVEAPLNNGHL